MIYELEDPLLFGKYKWKKLREVLEEDPQYIEWALEKGLLDIPDEVKLMISIAKGLRIAERQDFCDRPDIGDVHF